ncbi:MAG: ABC transporter permease [Thermoleophilia bacterium]|nr:ABC transporter permease [Thermoleophilia bacterium]
MVSSSRPAQDSRATAVISVTGGLIGAFALAFGPFVSFRPNRVVDGIGASAIDAFDATGWAVLILWCVAAFAVLAPQGAGRGHRPLMQTLFGTGRGVLASGAFILALAEAGRVASTFAEEQGSAARTSFGWTFYLFLFALFLVLYAASTETRHRLGRTAVGGVLLLGIVLLAVFGTLDELGVIREGALARGTFLRELTRHLFYALGATVSATILGIPLGIACARSRKAETAIMGVLNLGQVLPVLAFVGIMIPVLGTISDRLAGLKSLGISGIGWAPVMVVLLVYALFPITRNTLVAIQQLDPPVLDTAKGMGMGRWRSLREVELPLAFPIVLAGIRIALVQSTAGAIIAAFVGGGGLGTIMFMGLEQTSMDLVLVGVVPIVALALFFDTLLRAVERLSARGRRLNLESSGA